MSKPNTIKPNTTNPTINYPAINTLYRTNSRFQFRNLPAYAVFKRVKSTGDNNYYIKSNIDTAQKVGTSTVIKLKPLEYVYMLGTLSPVKELDNITQNKPKSNIQSTLEFNQSPQMECYKNLLLIEPSPPLEANQIKAVKSDVVIDSVNIAKDPNNLINLLVTVDYHLLGEKVKSSMVLDIEAIIVESLYKKDSALLDSHIAGMLNESLG